MNDEGRRCALPGCEVEIHDAHGRPERRYCSAGHRAAARQARRAAMHAQRRDAATADLAETLPWLRGATDPDPVGPDPADPDPAERAARAPDVATGPVLRPLAQHVITAAEPASVAQAAAARRSRDGGRTAARPRRRALAVLGVAGILAGGYAATARPEPSASPVPVQTAPDGETADAWAQRATVVLAAVNRQLDTLAQTEEQWRQLPASRSGVVPAPVTALVERRSVLQQRRATLQSQLDAYHSMRETQQDLADSEQHLQAVEKALEDTPPQPRRSAAQEASVTALDEQRDLRIRQRDAQRAELANLEDGVSDAARTPMPDDSADTARVSDDVLDVVRHGGRAPTTPDPAAPHPDVVDGRKQDDGEPSHDVGTSEPPEPRRPRDETEERRPGPGTAVPATDDPGADTLTALHERARQAAREAQRAEAARRAAHANEAAPPTPATPHDGTAPRDGTEPGPTAPTTGPSPSRAPAGVRGYGPAESGTPGAREPGTATGAPQPVPRPRQDGAGRNHARPTPRDSATRESSAADDRASAEPGRTRVTIHVVPGGPAGAVVDALPRANGPGRSSVGAPPSEDDDAVEQQNAAPPSGRAKRGAAEQSRPTGRHRKPDDPLPSGDPARPADPGSSEDSDDSVTTEQPRHPDRYGDSGKSDRTKGHSTMSDPTAPDPTEPDPGKSERETSDAREAGSERSDREKPEGEKSEREKPTRSARPFDPHDGYIRLSRFLAG